MRRKIPPELWVHGTRSTYVRGCRCDDCRRAHSQYAAQWRKKNQWKPSLTAHRKQRERQRHHTPEQWLEAYPYLNVALPDFYVPAVLVEHEEDMDWITRQLRSRQTIYASHVGDEGRHIDPEVKLEAAIEKRMQDEGFRAKVEYLKVKESKMERRIT